MSTFTIFPFTTILLLLILLIFIAPTPRAQQCDGEGGAACAAPTKTDGPLSILVDAWLDIPHSYAICTVFELVHLLKLYPRDKLQIYTRERKTGYYHYVWNTKKGAIKKLYPEKYSKLLLSSTKKYRGDEHIDVVYRRAFPHDLRPLRRATKTPTIVFYTAEYGEESFDDNTFVSLPERKLAPYLKKHRRRLWLTTPSNFSSRGMTRFLLPAKDFNKRLRVIPHGVDTSIFHRLSPAEVHAGRTKRGFVETDFVILSVGAMTNNKGISQLLMAMHELIHVHGQRHVKLLLKGASDLYSSRGFLQNALAEMQSSLPSLDAEADGQAFQETISHLKFYDSTVTFAELNEIYNIANLYVSPYLGEAFGLTPLEALAAGTPIVVPAVGGSETYTREIFDLLAGAYNASISGGSWRPFVTFVNSVATPGAGSNSRKLLNRISVPDLTHALLGCIEAVALPPEDDMAYSTMIAFIRERYSWSNAAEALYTLFLEVSENHRS